MPTPLKFFAKTEQGKDIIRDEIARTTQLRDKYSQQLEELAQSADGRSGAETVQMRYLLQRHIKTLENAMAEMSAALMPSSPTSKSPA